MPKTSIRFWGGHRYPSSKTRTRSVTAKPSKGALPAETERTDRQDQDRQETCATLITISRSYRPLTPFSGTGEAILTVSPTSPVQDPALSVLACG